MSTRNLGQARRQGEEVLFLHRGQIADRATWVAFRSRGGEDGRRPVR